MKKVKVIFSALALGMVVLFSCQKEDVVEIATKNTQNELKKYGCSCSASNLWGSCTVNCFGDPCMATCNEPSWFSFEAPTCSCGGTSAAKIIVKDENVIIMNGLISILKSHKNDKQVELSIQKIKRVQAFNNLAEDDYTSEEIMDVILDAQNSLKQLDDNIIKELELYCENIQSKSNE